MTICSHNKEQSSTPGEAVEHQLRLAYGKHYVNATQTNVSFDLCEQGTRKVTYTFRLLIPDKRVLLRWSSCHGTCHQPSIQLSNDRAGVGTRVHVYPQGGQFQDAFAKSHAEEPNLKFQLFLCHGLEVNVDQNANEEERRCMQASCFSVLRIANAPVEPGEPYLSESQYHTIVNMEIKDILEQVARTRGRLCVLNSIGVFTYVPTDVLPIAKAKEQHYEDGKAPDPWAKAITEGINGGLRTVLFRPLYATTTPSEDHTPVRVYFADKERYILSPNRSEHRREVEEWNSVPQNRDKFNAWADSITPKAMTLTGLNIHSEFFEDRKYGAMIMEWDHTTLQVVVPNVLKPSAEPFELHEPGPIVGKVNGEDLRCEKREHQYVVPWTYSEVERSEI